MRAMDQEVNPAVLQQQVTSLRPLAAAHRKCVCVHLTSSAAGSHECVFAGVRGAFSV